MYLPNLNSVALPVPERIWGIPKNWGVPGYAHGPGMDTPMVPFLENFSWAFARMDPVNVPAEFEDRGFTRS